MNIMWGTVILFRIGFNILSSVGWWDFELKILVGCRIEIVIVGIFIYFQFLDNMEFLWLIVRGNKRK